MFGPGKCEKVTYTCKCDCSLGCKYQTLKVNHGFKETSLDIEQVNTLFDVCESCYVLWSSWICSIDNPSYYKTEDIIDVCDVSLDYEQMSNNCLVRSQSPTPSNVQPSHLASPNPSPSEEEALEFLEKDVILRMLSLSKEFRPAYLWAWVNHTKADVNDVVYMMQVKEQLYDTWRNFQETGHGAIELGIFHYPNSLAYAPFGQESWYTSAKNTVFLKMNIDEYFALIAYVKAIINNVSPQSPTPSPSPRLSPSSFRSPGLRSVVSTPNDTSIDNGDSLGIVLAWWAITIIVVGGVVVITTFVCLIICCVRCCQR